MRKAVYGLIVLNKGESINTEFPLLRICPKRKAHNYLIISKTIKWNANIFIKRLLPYLLVEMMTVWC